MLYSIFRQPWLHFIVLGVSLYLLQQWSEKPAKMRVMPPTPEQLSILKEGWLQQTGQVPSAQQVKTIIDAELDRELLFHEAINQGMHLFDPVVFRQLVRNMRFLRQGESQTDEQLFVDAIAMDLHLNDELIRRRLIQLMKQKLLSEMPEFTPQQHQLEAYFQDNKQQFREPARYSFQHLFFPSDKADVAKRVLAQLRDGTVTADQAWFHSAPFLSGRYFEGQSTEQINAQFGAVFADALTRSSTPRAQWAGPIASTFGLHLVYIEHIKETELPTFQTALPEIARRLEIQHQEHVFKQQLEKIWHRYEVSL